MQVAPNTAGMIVFMAPRSAGGEVVMYFAGHSSRWSNKWGHEKRRCPLLHLLSKPPFFLDGSSMVYDGTNIEGKI